MNIRKKGKFFSNQLLKEIRDKFYYIDSDPYIQKSLLSMKKRVMQELQIA